MSAGLVLEGVGKNFGGLKAVSDVSFAVPEGAIVGLMGANGAGKTTLFALIAGNERPSEGAIRFDGQRIDGLSPDRVVKKGIARTFQIVRPFAGLSVRDNVRVAALYGRGGFAGSAEDWVAAALDETGLAEQADKPAQALTLSGRKRLEVARALATRPRLLLLDEVLAGLTPTEVAEALAMLRAIQAKHGLAILVIEHVMKALMRLCATIVVLHHGLKIAEGAPEAIAADPAVIEAYLGEGAAHA
ncbi:MAG: ABC transporter ATP-binding protein [Rhodospirillales bacterium]|nr:ABC transporter ATP-binding protein [Rhodospirillales bacterium]